MTSTEIQERREEIERALERQESSDTDDRNLMNVYLRAYVKMDNLVKYVIQELQESETVPPRFTVEVSISLKEADGATQDQASKEGQEGHGCNDREGLQCNDARLQEARKAFHEEFLAGLAVADAKKRAIQNALRLYGPEYFAES